MKERLFIEKAKEKNELEEFIRKHFSQAKCGSIEVHHTPIMTRIVINTITPGLVIGTAGERIRETIEVLKQKFKIDNPQIDVQKIEMPDLDPFIVSQSIAASIEAGINYKRLGNYYLSRVMNAGAIGCEIVISGKFSGQRARKERFIAGYLKKCGYPAEKDVMVGSAVANPRLGNVNVLAKIMLVYRGKVVLPQEKKEEKAEEIQGENDGSA